MSYQLSANGSAAAGVCSLHHSALIIFCDQCRELLCEDCLSSKAHRNHVLVRLRDACEKQIDEVTKQHSMLELRYKRTTDAIALVTKRKEELEESCDKATKTVEKLYEELEELIKKNKQQAKLLIQGVKKTRGMGLDKLAQEVDLSNRRVADIGRDVAVLRQNQEGNSVSTLLEVKALRSSIQAVEDFYKRFQRETLEDTTTNRLKALGESIEKILIENKKLLPRPWEFAENLTFDEKTADSNLSMSEDKTQVSYKLLSKGAEAFANILAAQSFTNGHHYWEVEVMGAKSWIVGLVEQGSGEKSKRHGLGEDCLSWALQLDGDNLLALHNDDIVSLKFESKFERLGVFLDYDKGQLQFYNVINGEPLHIFYKRFKNSVHPAFSIGREKNPVSHMESQLVLCQLVPQYQETVLYNAYESCA